MIGCRIYTSAEICFKCKENYYLSNNKCENIAENNRISNCIYYQDSANCELCTENYYISNGECKVTAAKNCKSANSSTSCETCYDGYGFKEENYVTNCVLIENPNCLEMDL